MQRAPSTSDKKSLCDSKSMKKMKNRINSTRLMKNTWWMAFTRCVIEHTEITMNISRCLANRICFVLSCEDEFCMLTNVAIAYSRQIWQSVHLPASQEDEDWWKNDEYEVDHGGFRFFELQKNDINSIFWPITNHSAAVLEIVHIAHSISLLVLVIAKEDLTALNCRQK